jgi:HEAT repeat protein
VSDKVATDQGHDGRADDRRRRVSMAGHGGDPSVARQGLADPAPAVRVAALGALSRLGQLTAADVEAALSDGTPGVRRRAAEVALRASGTGSRSSLPRAVTGALGDADPLVVVGAAWFLAERQVHAAVPALALAATEHADARCREAAVAALGALGDTDGLPAVLGALHDAPTVRRRATVALAGFDDPRVTPALRSATEDRDWQVRQAAGELLDEPPAGPVQSD